MRVRLRLNRLQRLLAESRLSQNHWALKLGLSRGHWSDIVNGKHPYPSARTRQGILEAFGAELEELFEIEPGPSGGDTDFRRAIADRYLIDRELGQGGMGTIYLARDVRHGRIVAVKAVSAESVSGIGVGQFLRETSTIAQLQHPNILTMLDSGEAAGQPYFVMPWVRDGSLRERLVRQIRLSLDETLWLTQGIAGALDRAHARRILHCDIKPENVLLDGNHPYVMDFGIAQVIHTEALEWGRREGLDISAGTPAYVSPEQASGEADLDARSDVYSLGCMVFEMLAGRPPFQESTAQATVARRFLGLVPDLREYAPDVPAPVAAVVAGAMALDRVRRPAGAGAFAEQLDAAARGASRRLAMATAVVSRAVNQARRRLGLTPAHRLGGSMTGLARDIVHAWRSLKRAPGFSLVVVLTLGLALGANATMFGIVDRLLLRPPPGITDPARVHRVVVRRWFNGLRNPSAALSFPAFEDIRTGTGSFSQVAAMESATLSYGRGPDARPLRVELVTGAYFAMLGTRPTHGRFFGEGEDRFPDGLPVVVLSHALWRSVFGARPDVLGQAMEISGNRYEIIAVAPPGFSGTELAGAEAWVPLGAGWRTVYSSYDGWRTGRGWQMLQVFGRVKPGVTPEAAADDLRRAYAAGHADYQIYERNAVAQLATLIPGRDPSRRNPAGRVAGWLLGVAVVVLLIACANVANLILARGFGRRTEMAVRQALGVSRGRLIRSLLAESLLLAGLGGLAGILIARWGGALLRGTLLPGITWDRNPVDGRVLVVTAAATIITAVVAGLIPLWRGARADIASVLHGGSRGISSHSRRLRGTLLLVQTTLCTALLIGAGLFVRSLSRVQGLDIGIEPDRMLRVQIDLAGAGVPPRGILAEHARLLERLRAIPTVEAAGAATSAPFMSNMSQGIRVPGFDSIPRLAGGGPYFFQATAGSLEALGTRLLRGRRITAADERAGAPPVMVVSGRMARTLWPDADPLGKCAFVGDGPCHEVVGVIGDMHRQSLREEPFMLYFVPLSASDTTSMPSVILIRTSGRPERLAETIRREILALRSDLPFINVQPYSEVLDAQSQSWRLGATMFAVFGALSLLMAGVGLYGVLSYAVVQRTRELGIRAALGASPRALVRLVVRSGAAAAAGGVFLGIGIVLLLGRWLQALLFETSVLDGQAFAVAALTVGSVGILASVIPARRATRVTPLEALRSE